MRLQDALEGLGIAVPFYPSLARMLDSDSGALLLAQFWFISSRRCDDDGWFHIGREEIEDMLGMARRRQENARKSMKARGVLIERKSGMPRRTEYRIDFDALEVLWTQEASRHDGTKRTVKTVQNVPSIPTFLEESKKEKRPDGTPPVLFESSPASFSAIISGALDSAPRNKLRALPDAALRPLVDAWADTWGVPRGRALVTDKRRKVWRQVIDQGASPSDFAKAILGMRHDDYADRRKYNDWHKVAEYFDKWVGLYDEHGAPGQYVKDAVDSKIVKGVRVPVDYIWNAADDHQQAQGCRFNLEKQRWVKR